MNEVLGVVCRSFNCTYFYRNLYLNSNFLICINFIHVFPSLKYNFLEKFLKKYNFLRVESLDFIWVVPDPREMWAITGIWWTVVEWMDPSCFCLSGYHASHSLFFLWQNSINSFQFSFFFMVLIMNFIYWSLWILQKYKSLSSHLPIYKWITLDDGHSDRFYLLYPFFQIPKPH